MTVSTPDLCDAYPDQVRVLEPLFRIYGGKHQFAGQIATVKCFDDNSLVREFAAQDGTGKVLVVDGGGSLRRALLGDMIAAELVKNGWEGIVINGCVRDVEALNTLDLGIRALNSIPVKTEKRGLGDANALVRFASVEFKPGQWLYADESGMVVSDEPLKAG
ncbi:MAG: putative 4-hydroxy-4-methyl-2-oxoglutarate aldolase [Proteobacteria bacterium]|nr:MAG: putative 4-hydroxy-4-methyl-2-oxoglutarate aldolase [Pseudomonadota bacterium]QKK10768.1 MAG: ribonuclease E activity regulator RraA [Pseudomonadota bacterium]